MGHGGKWTRYLWEGVEPGEYALYAESPKIAIETLLSAEARHFDLKRCQSGNVPRIFVLRRVIWAEKVRREDSAQSVAKGFRTIDAVARPLAHASGFQEVLTLLQRDTP